MTYLKVAETSNFNLPLLYLLYCTHSINLFKLTNVMSFPPKTCESFCKRQLLPSKYFAPISIGSASRDSIPATVKNWSSVEQ